MLLGRFVRWIRGPRGTDFYALAERAKRVPSAELAVAEAALTSSGQIGERLLRQLREAPDVWRLRSGDGTYELRVSTTLAPIRDVPRSGWRTEWIPLEVAHTGRRLEMQIVAEYSGIGGILGRTSDGAQWPKEWAVRVEDIDLVRKQAPWLRFPTVAELKDAREDGAARLSAWLEAAELLRGRRGSLRVEAPATNEEIDGLAERESFALPDAYRALLTRVNGFELGRLVILGTGDAYRLDIPGPDRLVISPPDEDGALTLAPSGEVVWVAYGDETGDGQLRATDLRSWVQQQLARRPSRDMARR
jgi:hypothetical protein